MTMKRKMPWRNKSPYGWWTASYIQRFEWKSAPPIRPRSRCLAWENTILIHAKGREAAHGKAIKFAERSANSKWELLGDPPGRLGRWVLEGLTELLPIYEPIQDGSEIFWTEYSSAAITTLRRRIKTKGKLGVFQD
jgi:hypothetical protein